MRTVFIKICLAFVLMMLIGCSQTRNIISDSYRAADVLLDRAPDEITTDTPFLVTSFVNINNLEESTTFGRLLSEQIASKVSQNGFRVKEIKLSDGSLFVIKGSGEFVLSRRLENIRASFNSNYVIVGTYSVGYESVYVSSRIVRIDDSVIVSSYDFKIRGDDDLWELIKNQ
ncbi:FlgO family outer membrane protein [Thermodesulfobacteriota bacterium]